MKVTAEFENMPEEKESKVELFCYCFNCGRSGVISEAEAEEIKEKGCPHCGASYLSNIYIDKN